MKIESPLSNLISRCQTICVPECCGVDAYDFSPIHIASYLSMYRGGSPDMQEIAEILCQLNSLETNYGCKGASGIGATIDEMNQIFTGEQIDNLVKEIKTNLDAAILLLTKSEEIRYVNAKMD